MKYYKVSKRLWTTF